MVINSGGYFKRKPSLYTGILQFKEVSIVDRIVAELSNTTLNKGIKEVLNERYGLVRYFAGLYYYKEFTLSVDNIKEIERRLNG